MGATLAQVASFAAIVLGLLATARRLVFVAGGGAPGP
jgi:hypothetical protein